jgi:hypothetical protein
MNREATIATVAAFVLYAGGLLTASDRRTNKLQAAQEAGDSIAAVLATRQQMNILDKMADGNDYILQSAGEQFAETVNYTTDAASDFCTTIRTSLYPEI